MDDSLNLRFGGRQLGRTRKYLWQSYVHYVLKPIQQANEPGEEATLKLGERYYKELSRTHADAIERLEARCTRGITPSELGQWINAHESSWLRKRLRYAAYYIRHGNHDEDGSMYG